MEKMIFLPLMLMMLSSCASVQKSQSNDSELVELKIEKADLKQFQFEDSLTAESKSPFSPSTRLVFSVPKKDSIEIVLYDVNGELISQTFSQVVDKGDYQVKFDGSSIPSGVYFVRYKIGNGLIMKKFIFLK